MCWHINDDLVGWENVSNIYFARQQIQHVGYTEYYPLKTEIFVLVCLN